MPSQQRHATSTCGASAVGAVISATATGFFWVELTWPLYMAYEGGGECYVALSYVASSALIIGLMGCVGIKVGEVTSKVVTQSIAKLHTLFSSRAESQYLLSNTENSATPDRHV